MFKILCLFVTGASRNRVDAPLYPHDFFTRVLRLPQHAVHRNARAISLLSRVSILD
jgi:hypothetical protein